MAKRKPGPNDGREAERILDAALCLADAEGWNNLRLRTVAEASGVTLAELRRHYRDQDAIADAWFRRAQDAMLAAPPTDFFERPVRDRLMFLLERWFGALAPHHRVTADMLRAKMWYAHPHHYVPMVFNLSRLIQWLRDAAGMDAGGRQRQIEEIGLSLLFVAALRLWCRDDSAEQERTHAWLDRRLRQADRSAACMFCKSRRTETTHPHPSSSSG